MRLTTEVQGGPKIPDCLRVDNFATVSYRKVCGVSKASKFRLESAKTWIAVEINILRLVYINMQLNAFEFMLNLTKTLEFYPIFHSNKQ